MFVEVGEEGFPIIYEESTSKEDGYKDAKVGA
jgi:hypothetical protein